VSNVSHELRTPISAIKGFVETLLEIDLGAQPRETHRYLGIVNRATDRLHNIVDDLLTLSRIEHIGSIERQKCPLLPILHESVSLCRGKFPGRANDVHIRIEDKFSADVNSSLIEQAVVNLIDNAFKYSDANTPVVIRLLKDKEYVHIEVEDKGCGIASRHLERLWERFYVVDKARSREKGGTGLGLSIVKHIALAHDGKVDVSSKVGIGSIFRLSIPHKPAQQGKAHATDHDNSQG
jgi:two-component system phosphate regulon sensor histidine kinase PhoR